MESSVPPSLLRPCRKDRHSNGLMCVPLSLVTPGARVKTGELHHVEPALPIHVKTLTVHVCGGGGDTVRNSISASYRPSDIREGLRLQVWYLTITIACDAGS